MKTNKFYKYFIGYFLLAIMYSGVFADEVVNVLVDQTKPVTYRASGFIHGFNADPVSPPDDMVIPLNIQLNRTYPSAAWDQRERMATLGITQQVVISDGWRSLGLGLPGANGNWSPWEDFVEDLVEDWFALGLHPQWDIWNEPDQDSWQTGQFNELWRRAYLKIRQVDPQAVIVGPSWGHTYPGDNDFDDFLVYCKNSNVVPNYISWHFLDRTLDLVQQVEDCRDLMDYLNINNVGIIINEYCSAIEQYSGGTAWRIATIERAEVDAACHANWNSANRGHLDGILTIDNEPKGQWWVYQRYAAITGELVETVPTERIELVAGKENGVVRVLLGSSGCFTGSPGLVDIHFEGLDVPQGHSVYAMVELIPEADGGVVDGPQIIFSRQFNVYDGAVDVTFPWVSNLDAYAVTLVIDSAGHWNFDEEAGPTAEDSSANSNDGTLTNMDTGSCWVSGKDGAALLFDGDDDYVDCGNAASLEMGTSDFSIEAWIKFSSITDTEPRIVSKGIYPGWFLGIAGNGNCLQGSIGKSDGRLAVYGATNVRDGQWHHVALTFDRDGLEKLYVDGNLDESRDISSYEFENITTTAHCRIGEGSGRHFNGTIDEVRVCRRVLSAEEISDHANLIGHWSFSEKEGSIAHDSLGWSDGDLTNMDTGSCWVSGKDGAALLFDGDDDYVDCGNAASLEMGTSDFSIEAWIKFSSITDLEPRIVSKGIYPGWFLGIAGNGNCLQGSIGKSDGRLAVYGTTNVRDGQWHHVALTFDRDGLEKLYVDGNLDASRDISSYAFENITTTTHCRIGEGSGRHFNGTIDEVRVCRRVLSAEEISDHAIISVAHWKMDTGNGITVYDSAGSNDGTLINMDTGSCWVSGQDGTGLLFDGDDDYVDCGNAASLEMGTSDFSIEAWIKFSSITDLEPRIVSKGIYPGWFLGIAPDGNCLQGSIGKSDGRLKVYGITNVKDGQWHHVALTFDRDGLERLYVDGNLDASCDISSYVLEDITTTTHCRIGEGSGKHFNGTIDEVRVYRRVLSAEEIWFLAFPN